MSSNSQWKERSGRCALAVALSAIVSAMANPASGCGLTHSFVPTALRGAPVEKSMELIPAVFHADSGGFVAVDYGSAAGTGGIVGLWKFSMVSDGVSPNPVPAGAPVDFGTVQWHDDGTELMVSGGRAPSTGDVCMGVWEKIGARTYKLKHLALAWVSSDTPPAMGGPGPSPAQFLGPAVIQEVVTLDRARTSYTGSFTLDQYNADESVLLVHVSGAVTATRVTVD